MKVTITHKVKGAWEEVEADFPTIDHAKRHALEEVYAEYKVWQHGQLQAHLFNAHTKDVSEETVIKKKKSEKLEVLVNLVPKEVEEESDSLEALADEWDKGE